MDPVQSARGRTTSKRLSYFLACFAGQGDRTPQVGDEIAILGFGGMVWFWFAGKIFAQQTTKGQNRGGNPNFVSEVYNAESQTKTLQKLTRKIYGSAQCIIGDVRVGGKTIMNSCSAGWVFLVPTSAPLPPSQ